MLSEEQVLFGISFYGEEKRQASILECVRELNSSEFLPTVEKIYDTLYFGKTEELEKLYAANSAEKMFRKGIPPMTPIVMFMLGGKIHDENMRRFAFDEAQVQKQKAALGMYIDIVSNVGNTTALAWSANFVRGDLIEAGILQFQTLYKDDGTPEIYIHIPGGNLKTEDVLRSVCESRELMKRYYGIENAEYKCDSWLLSPEIHEMLNENSNIYRFYELFDVTPGANCKDDILWNLFHVTEPSASLDEKTSLQRKVKAAFAEGKEFFCGIGRWKG